MKSSLKIFIVSLLFLIITLTTFGSDTSVLRIMTTSDLHGRFFPYDYAINAENLNGSLVQLYPIIDELSDDLENVILIDVGDTVQDNSADIFFDEPVHPMIEGLNEIGYDYWVIGNHEFNFGVPTLQKVMEQFEGEVLCGNVYLKKWRQTCSSIRYL